jgi:hypothetical protein
MAFQVYQCVRLRTDRFEESGAKNGDVGFIIEIYSDGNFELEFSRPDGTTYALFVAGPEDVEPCESE